MWKGDKVGYGKLHEWVKNRIIKPEICPRCKKRKAYDLANKGIYNRDLKNWEYLCRKCHMKSDGRMNVFLKNQRKFPKNNKYYKLREELKGEKHPGSKLTKEKVIEIRIKYATGKYSLANLSKQYNVCFQNIGLIVNRKSWKHI